MLVYLDTMILQYCIDYAEFVFGEISGKTHECPTSDLNLKQELWALRQLIYYDQMANLVYACSPELLRELKAAKPNESQRKLCSFLEEAWKESGWSEAYPLESSEILRIENSLKHLNLRDPPDRRHLAEAIVLKASWFLTNDKDIIRKCKQRDLPLHVARPSESLDEMLDGLFLK